VRRDLDQRWMGRELRQQPGRRGGAA